MTPNFRTGFSLVITAALTGATPPIAGAAERARSLVGAVDAPVPSTVELSPNAMRSRLVSVDVNAIDAEMRGESDSMVLSLFDDVDVRVRFDRVSHVNRSRRYAIGIQYADAPPVYLRLEPEGTTEARLRLPTHQRGQFKPQGITVFTRYPTGLFHAWGWLNFDLPILVYPRPLENVRLQQTMIAQYDGKTSTSTIEGDDFAGLREHRKGESLRHISWKAYARGKGLLTKTFQGNARPSLWIDWALLREGSPEEKLSLMTALVLAAEKEEQKYGLRLPDLTIDQDFGNAHKHACLLALALFRQPDPDSEFRLDDE